MLSVITKETENGCKTSTTGKATFTELVFGVVAIKRLFKSLTNLNEEEARQLMRDIINQNIEPE